jgi:ubiquinone/menaquinone biosynthesis C-methylase UbiE
MLDKAREALPHLEFHDGDLAALPLESARFDLVVCALALEHVPDLDGAVAELSRVLRRGGRMVLSDLHPAAAVLGGAAYFQDAAGDAGVEGGYGHLRGAYLRAFHPARLEIRQCLEPRFGAAEAAMQGPAAQFIPDAAAAAYIGVPGAVVSDLVRA